MANPDKVFVIGLDGVPFDIIRQWADEGHMPVFKRLIEEGVAGSLGSTMPPTSGPSWSSFTTGKNPGKTGIYDFLYRRPGSYVFPPVSARMRSGRSLWSILSERGKKVGVVNLPISYPVEKVNGVLVSGWMTPYYAKDYTYPPELAAEIDREVGDYRIYPAETFAEGRKDAFFKACDELLELLTRTTMHLMDRDDWDFFMTVYFDTDRVFHQLWHYLDPAHPWRADDKRDLSTPVKRYFSRLDADVGRLLDKLPEDTRVMVMSDHGMGTAARFIVLNNLLLETGWIKLADDAGTRMKAFAFRRGFTLRNVHKIVDRLGLAKHAEYKNVYSFDGVLKRFFLSFLNVDWRRTRAYSFGRHYGSLYLNVNGREPQGCVAPGKEYERAREELSETLLSYVDPELGRRLFARAIKREDLYAGKHFDEAPDLIVTPQDPTDIVFGLSDFGSNRVWDATYRYSGMHREDGMIIAHGPGVRSGESFAGGAVIDLAPTILHWMDQAVPADMDGRPLASMMTDDFMSKRPVCVAEPVSDRDDTSAHDYSTDEEEEIMDRLRDLGYMN